MSPAERPPEELLRRRAINQKLYEQTAKREQFLQHISPGQAETEFLPTGNISIDPEIAQQWRRPWNWRNLIPGKPLKNPAPLPPRLGMDATLLRATADHELGEQRISARVRAHFDRRSPEPIPGLLPHASHAGLEPVLMEDQALIGDPQAVYNFKKLRNSNTDDWRVQKLKKSMGYHPDSPMPLYGKQHRALEQRLIKDVSKIDSPSSIAAARQLTEEGYHSLAPVGKNLTNKEFAIQELKELPKELASMAKQTLVDTAKKVWSKLRTPLLTRL